MIDFPILFEDLQAILSVVPKTLAMALSIFVLATLIGSIFAMVEYRRIPVLREFVVAYKVAFKGPPMVIVIFLAYFGFPVALQYMASLVGIEYNAYWTPNWVILIVGITTCIAAFEAEIIKGALNSFDTGQADAARSLGYSDRQMFRRVMFPQVVAAAIPDLTTSTMVIMKALSLGFAIEVVEIFGQAQIIAALNFYYLEAFLVAVVVYMTIAYIVTQIADKAEAMLRVRS